MNLKFLHRCVVIVFFFALNVLGDSTVNEPEWFTRFQQKYNSDKEKNEKLCAMFDCLPEDVRRFMLDKLTKTKIRLYQPNFYDFVRYDETIEKYAANAQSYRFFNKNTERLKLALGVMNHTIQPQFSDEFRNKGLSIMLSELDTIRGFWFYPAWHVSKFIECIKRKGICEYCGGIK